MQMETSYLFKIGFKGSNVVMVRRLEGETIGTRLTRKRANLKGDKMRKIPNNARGRRRFKLNLMERLEHLGFEKIGYDTFFSKDFKIRRNRKENEFVLTSKNEEQEFFKDKALTKVVDYVEKAIHKLWNILDKILGAKDEPE